jgi:hypothetical protein
MLLKQRIPQSLFAKEDQLPRANFGKQQWGWVDGMGGDGEGQTYDQAFLIIFSQVP